MAWVPVWIRVDMELFEFDKVEPGLFLNLSYYCCLNRFTIIDKTSGQGPAIWGVSPLNEDDPPLKFDYGVNGGERVTGSFRNRSLPL
jgi:hypothetical protein